MFEGNHGPVRMTHWQKALPQDPWATSLHILYLYGFALMMLPWFLPQTLPPTGDFTSFVDYVRSVIPTIDRFAARSESPDLIRGFLAVLWVLFIPAILSAGYFVPKRLRRPLTRMEWFAIVIAPIIVFYKAFYVGMFTANPASIKLGYLEGSYQAYLTFGYSGHFGLGVMGSLFFLSMSLLVLIEFHWIRAVVFYRKSH